MSPLELSPVWGLVSLVRADTERARKLLKWPASVPQSVWRLVFSRTSSGKFSKQSAVLRLSSCRPEGLRLLRISLLTDMVGSEIFRLLCSLGLAASAKCFQFRLRSAVISQILITPCCL